MLKLWQAEMESQTAAQRAGSYELGAVEVRYSGALLEEGLLD